MHVLVASATTAARVCRIGLIENLEFSIAHGVEFAGPIGMEESVMSLVRSIEQDAAQIHAIIGAIVGKCHTCKAGHRGDNVKVGCERWCAARADAARPPCDTKRSMPTLPSRELARAATAQRRLLILAMELGLAPRILTLDIPRAIVRRCRNP